MNMGDVFAIFGTLLALGIALPAMLLTWALLFPNTIGRARMRLQHTPMRCFLFGTLFLLLAVPIIVLLFAIPLPATKWLGGLSLCALLTCASLGLAGLARLVGDRLRSAGVVSTAPGALLRGAIVLELSVVIPFIGWFIVLPLTAVCVLGAAGFALLRWNPHLAAAPAPAGVAHGPHTP